MTTNRAKRRSEKRRKLRKRFKAEGMTDEVAIERRVWAHECKVNGIEHITDRMVDDLVLREMLTRYDADTAYRMVFGRDAYNSPNDNAFRPTSVPAELRGTARATGQTATAVRKGQTVTDWQHAERDRGIYAPGNAGK